MENEPAKNGIRINNETCIMTDRKRNGAAVLAVRALLLLLGVLPVVAIATASVAEMSVAGASASVDTTMIYTALTLAALAMAAFTTLKGRVKLIAAGLLGTGLLALFITNLKSIGRGLRSMGSVLIGGFCDNYNLNIKTLPANASAKALTAALIFIGLLTVLSVGAAFANSSFHFLGILIPALPVACCLIAGFVPETLFAGAFATYCAAFAVYSACDGGSTEEAGRSIRYMSALFCVALLGVSLLLGRLFISANDYKARGHIESLRNSLQAEILEMADKGFVDWVREKTTSAGFAADIARAGLSEGRLAVAPRVTYLDNELFTINLPNPQSDVYIRTFAGDEYTGEAWKDRHNDIADDLEQQEEFFEELQEDEVWRGYRSADESASGDSKAGRTASDIKDKASALADDKGYRRTKSDLPLAINAAGIVSATTKLELPKYYTTNYFEPWIRGNSEELHLRDDRTEKKSREDAYENYLEVPEKLEKKLKKALVGAGIAVEGNASDAEFKLFGEEKLGLSPEKVLDAVAQVRELLSSKAQYSLKPGDLPKGSDYIDYFFFENGKGYCAHFASTAVMLFRTLGIPARYVEGYMVSAEEISASEELTSTEAFYISGRGGTSTKVADIKKVSVKDRNVHAWAEVYIDGYGWYVAETTPGYNHSANEKLKFESDTTDSKEEGTDGKSGDDSDKKSDNPNDKTDAQSSDKSENANTDETRAGDYSDYIIEDGNLIDTLTGDVISSDVSGYIIDDGKLIDSQTGEVISSDVSDFKEDGTLSTGSSSIKSVLVILAAALFAGVTAIVILALNGVGAIGRIYDRRRKTRQHHSTTKEEKILELYKQSLELKEKIAKLGATDLLICADYYPEDTYLTNRGSILESRELSGKGSTAGGGELSGKGSTAGGGELSGRSSMAEGRELSSRSSMAEGSAFVVREDVNEAVIYSIALRARFGRESLPGDLDIMEKYVQGLKMLASKSSKG